MSSTVSTSRAWGARAGWWRASLLLGVTVCAAGLTGGPILAEARDPLPPDRAGPLDLEGLDPGAARRRAQAEEARKPKVPVSAHLGARRGYLEAALRARPEDPELCFALAKVLHLQGVDGDEQAAERAEDLLDAVLARRPKEPLVLAYRGSAHLLAAKRVWFWNKGERVERGLVLLDRAVALTPETHEQHLEVRFLRGVSCYALPFFFDRGEQARADLATVGAGAEAAARAGRMDPLVAAAALFYDGVCKAEAGEQTAARDAFAAAAALAPGSSHGRAAKARLEADRDG